jgi:hypothetical protein
MEFPVLKEDWFWLYVINILNIMTDNKARHYKSRR